MEDHKINIILNAKKIMSVNALYGAKLTYIKGRPTAQIYKKSEAKQMEHYISEQIKLLNIPVNYPWVTENTKFKLTFTVIFNTGFYLRDLDNCCKNLVDGIFRALGINDSHVIKLVAEKKYLPGISDEKILVCLQEVSDDDIRLDKFFKPHIIWCNNSSVTLGLPEAKKQPKKDKLYITSEKSKADTKLFIIQPGDYNYATGMNIAFEIDENILETKGFSYIAILNSKDWSEVELRGIEELEKTINEISKNVYSGIKIKRVNDLSEILKWIEGDE